MDKAAGTAVLSLLWMWTWSWGSREGSLPWMRTWGRWRGRHRCRGRGMRGKGRRRGQGRGDGRVAPAVDAGNGLCGGVTAVDKVVGGERERLPPSTR